MAPSKSVLVINSGSSSLKYALFDLGKTATCIYQGLVDGIGTSKSFISHRNVPASHDIKLQAADCTDHKQGLKKVLELLNFGKGYSGIAAVGHRVVHGGETLTEPTIITDSVKRAIEKAIPLAPLHNPPNLQV
jgi:acetate kinase